MIVVAYKSPVIITGIMATTRISMAMSTVSVWLCMIMREWVSVT